MKTILASCAVLLWLPSCVAAPITFIYESTGTGSMGAMQFANTHFVVTAYGDTSNRRPIFYFGFPHSQFAFDIKHDSGEILLDGIGRFNFISSTRTFVNFEMGLAGLSHYISPADTDGNDLIYSLRSETLSAWDMLTSIGPLTGIGSLLQWNTLPFLTDGGILQFSTNSFPTTFTSIYGLPEPTSLMLLALASCGLLGIRRR